VKIQGSAPERTPDFRIIELLFHLKFYLFSSCVKDLGSPHFW
jgi:hypothetical protein